MSSRPLVLNLPICRRGILVASRVRAKSCRPRATYKNPRSLSAAQTIRSRPSPNIPELGERTSHTQSSNSNDDRRTLSTKEKQAYIDAVKCLQTKPSELASTYQSPSRFDDYNAVHIDLTEQIHFCAPFLPWHRLFVKQYEADLQNLCGYKGAQP